MVCKAVQVGATTLLAYARLGNDHFREFSGGHATSGSLLDKYYR